MDEYLIVAARCHGVGGRVCAVAIVAGGELCNRCAIGEGAERGSTRTCSVASTVSALRCGEGCSALQRLSMSGQDAQQAGWEWTNT